MPKLARTTLVLLGAAFTLSLLVSTASANHLSTSTRSIRTTWTSLEFVEPLGTTFRCSLSLEGSLHSATMTKTAEALVGFITRASVARSCTGGEFSVLTETLPWHLRYAGFTGILPDITSLAINLVGFALKIKGSFGTCLFTSSASQPFRNRYNLNASHAVTGVEIEGTITSNEGCGPFGERVTSRLKGNSTTNSAQTITLI